MSNPYDVVKQFEAELCAYTGARYAVTTNSCTAAIELALLWHHMNGHRPSAVVIPRFTYKSVPDSVVRAGYSVQFRDEEWRGDYRLDPFPIWDSARRFTSGMYVAERMVCVSFHVSKILGINQGGAILHDNPQADIYFRRARFDGRGEGIAPRDDVFKIPPQYVRHCYMNNDTAAALLLRLHSLPKHNSDLLNDPYKDLSTCAIYQNNR